MSSGEIPKYKRDRSVEVLVIQRRLRGQNCTGSKGGRADTIVPVFATNKGLAIAFKEGLMQPLTVAQNYVNMMLMGSINALEIPKSLRPSWQRKSWDGAWFKIPWYDRAYGSSKDIGTGSHHGLWYCIRDKYLWRPDRLSGFNPRKLHALVIHTGYTYTQETHRSRQHINGWNHGNSVEFQEENGRGITAYPQAYWYMQGIQFVTLVRTYTLYNPLCTFTYIGGLLF